MGKAKLREPILQVSIMSASGECQLIPSARKQMSVEWAGERKGHKETLGLVIVFVTLTVVVPVVSFCLVCQSTQTRQVIEITNIFYPDEYFSSIFSPR